jgi:hypothetical protein
LNSITSSTTTTSSASAYAAPHLIAHGELQSSVVSDDMTVHSEGTFTHSNHPIGSVDPSVSGRTASLLDHRDEIAQIESHANADRSLTTEDLYKGVAVVVKETPDEQSDDVVAHWSKEDEARKQVPVFAYPENVMSLMGQQLFLSAARTL